MDIYDLQTSKYLQNPILQPLSIKAMKRINFEVSFGFIWIISTIFSLDRTDNKSSQWRYFKDCDLVGDSYILVTK